MKANKIILNKEVLIDLTQDTVTESDVVSGKTFHKADGTKGVGTAGEVILPIDTLDESLLIQENIGKLYKHNGKLYTIHKTYVPIADKEQVTSLEGKAFSILLDKEQEDTIPFLLAPGDYSIMSDCYIDGHRYDVFRVLMAE